MRFKFTIVLSLLGQTFLLGQSKINFDFPGGLILTSSFCSAECCPKQEDLYLFENGNCILRQTVNQWNFDRMTYFGTWIFRDSSIIINYKKYYGGQGIDQGTKDWAYGCFGIGYKTYKAISKSVERWDTIFWTTFKHQQTNSIRHIHVDNKRNPVIYRANYEDFNFLHSTISNESRRIYSEQYLSKLTKTELRLLRNEVYARYGYIFTSSDLTEYFKGQPWYVPKYENVDAFLNERDKLNIELTQKFEKLN